MVSDIYTLIIMHIIPPCNKTAHGARLLNLDYMKAEYAALY
jgi:hypothetical protein